MIQKEAVKYEEYVIIRCRYETAINGMTYHLYVLFYYTHYYVLMIFKSLYRNEKIYIEC